MTRSNGAGVNKLVWSILSAIGAILFALGMFLLNSSASRTQFIQAKLGDHEVRLAKAELRADAAEARASTLSGQVSALEAKIERLKNPPPWERQKGR